MYTSTSSMQDFNYHYKEYKFTNSKVKKTDTASVKWNYRNTFSTTFIYAGW